MQAYCWLRSVGAVRTEATEKVRHGVKDFRIGLFIFLVESVKLQQELLLQRELPHFQR